MADNKSKSKATIPSLSVISTTVGIVFIVLKLAGIIDWSWWAVTAPIWVPVATFVAVMIMAFLGIMCHACIKALVQVMAKKEV